MYASKAVEAIVDGLPLLKKRLIDLDVGRVYGAADQFPDHTDPTLLQNSREALKSFARSIGNIQDDENDELRSHFGMHGAVRSLLMSLKVHSEDKFLAESACILSDSIPMHRDNTMSAFQNEVMKIIAFALCAIRKSSSGPRGF